MKTELLYRHTPMNPKPTNTSMESLVDDLKTGHTVSVTLEPGDATRYDLLLIPMHSVKIGNYGSEDERAGLVVVRIRSGEATGCGVVLLNRGGYYDAEVMRNLSGGNDWTQELFRWWFDLLWDELSG